LGWRDGRVRLRLCADRLRTYWRERSLCRDDRRVRADDRAHRQLAAAAITVFAGLESRRAAAVIVGLLALAIACGAYETAVIVPQMQQTPLLTPAYEALHRESSSVYAGALLAALIALAASSRRNTRG